MSGESGRRVHARRGLPGVEILCYRAAEGPVPRPRKNLAGEILDISQGGARLRLLEAITRGETLTVELKDRRSGESFRARGEVRWCASETADVGGRHYVGLQFQEIYTPLGRREKFTVGPRMETGDKGPDPVVFEKRTAPRFWVDDYLVTCLPRGPLSSAGLKRNLAREVLDLSRRGVRLRVTERLKPGACFQFTLHLNRFGDTLETAAEVRWCRPEAPPAGTAFLAGLQFLNLSEEKGKKIDFLKGWLEKNSK
jgi:hypothetical protein